MSDLTKLPNIGPVLAEKLQNSGIHSLAELVESGSVQAVLNIREQDENACCNMLYALEGAIRGVRWHAIPKEERAKLREELLKARELNS